MLRHTLATLAYRGGKTLRGAPADFAGFGAAPGVRTPGEIVAHISDLLDWALSIAEDRQAWHDSPPLSWDDGAARFYTALAALDRRLAETPPAEETARKLFQGPVADALTHVGQIAILRRLAGYPVKGENYAVAEIVEGRVGAEQAAARREF